MNITILNEDKIKKVGFFGLIETNSHWIVNGRIMTYSPPKYTQPVLYNMQPLSKSENAYFNNDSTEIEVSINDLNKDNLSIKDGKVYINPRIEFHYDNGSYEIKYFPDMIEAESFLRELEKNLKFNTIKYQN